MSDNGENKPVEPKGNLCPKCGCELESIGGSIMSPDEHEYLKCGRCGYKKEKEQEVPAAPEQEVPEFKNEYYWAFMALALYKIGNIETIPIEALEKFDAERDSPDIIYNPESKSFSLMNKEYEIPKKIVTAAKIPRKIRRKFLRNISRN